MTNEEKELVALAVRLAELEIQHGPADFTITDDSDFPSDGQRARYELEQKLGQLSVEQRSIVYKLQGYELERLKKDSEPLSMEDRYALLLEQERLEEDRKNGEA